MHKYVKSIMLPHSLEQYYMAAFRKNAVITCITHFNANKQLYRTKANVQDYNNKHDYKHLSALLITAIQATKCRSNIQTKSY